MTFIKTYSEAAGQKLLYSGKEPLSDFQCRVYETLLKVPPGKVTTYKDLANAIDCKSSQAVGQALRRNPYAPAVPCHRVVQKNRSMGGFFGQTSGSKIDEKIHLLQQEGVKFESDGRVDPESIFQFTTLN